MNQVSRIFGVLASIGVIIPMMLSAQQREVVNLPDAPAPNPSAPAPVLSNAIKIGNMMWVSGQLGTTQGQTVGDIEKETAGALDKIKKTLEAGGFSMKDVVAVQVYLVDIKDFQKMNGVYRTYFTDTKPTRTTVQVAALANPVARVEITSTAMKSQ
jgi:2-iminobutanoate/2-iminopropanoate deaminase